MEHDEDVIGRLRALGRHPVDGVAAAGHLDTAGLAAYRPPRRWVTLAAVLVAVIGVPAAGIAAARVGGDGPAPVVGVGQPGGEPEPLACTGPPPFAGQVPAGDTEIEREANRAIEAAEFDAWREANCPEEGSLPPERSVPPQRSGPSDPVCIGPPPFAEVPATPTDPEAGRVPSPRAAEAAVLSEQRSSCNDESASTTAATSTPVPASPSLKSAGPPVAASSVGASENGPPEGVPAGPPEGVPAGPPEGVPAGPPEGVPAGPPDGPPEGVPAGVPDGPPEGVPAGPPDNEGAEAHDGPGGPPDVAPDGGSSGGGPGGPGGGRGGGPGG